MEHFYTDEKNTQILLTLMKAHGVRKIVASPGTTNISFVASAQQDSYFDIVSSVDERSAAYIACGIAAESGEPVALSCTGATASRNYLSGLTEAYYRKLPILAITSTYHLGRTGQYMPQMLDRSQVQKDVVKMSINVRTVHSEEDQWDCERSINEALLELRHAGGGPVHVNLETTGDRKFSVKELPKARVIDRICYKDELPQLEAGRVGIYVGAHKKWTQELTELVDAFCECYDAVVLCDHTSNYRGKYRILPSIVTSQDEYFAKCRKMNVMLHIGDVSGAYMNFLPKEVWRIDADGVLRDTFKRLKYVFEMEEVDFFRGYIEKKSNCSMAYYEEWKKEIHKLIRKIPELPFSNLWIAQNTIQQLPHNSLLYLGILNSLRSWNFFESPYSVVEYANVGGFGIDGGLSSLLGASLVDKNKICFGIMGDLATFYDLNVLANRHVQNNLRIMVINNGRGTEFRNYNHPGSAFEDEADQYIAAAGHFGNKSTKLLKHYAQDLGFEYLCASNKEEYLENVSVFLTTEKKNAPVIFEVFTDTEDESNALRLIRNVGTRQISREFVLQLLGNGQKKIIGIYAATKLAKRIIETSSLIEELKEVQLLVYDTNQSKWGTSFAGHEISSPENIISDKVERLVIANDMYFDEIYTTQKYLKEYGIEIVGIENE